MCRRVLLVGAASAVLALYQGKAYSKVSFDSRCEPSTTFDEKLGQDVISFAYSDKPGVMILSPGEKVQGAEFTDTVPDDALIIEYVEPEETSE